MREDLQLLKDEIARLKGQKARPKIKPSTLEPRSQQRTQKNKEKRKRKKRLKKLKIHKEKIIEPTEIPTGSRFKGCKPYTIQDIVFEVRNTRYLLATYVTPEGKYLKAKLPEDCIHGHFGHTLVTYIHDQYYNAHVPEPTLLKQLHDKGIVISSGELHYLLSQKKEAFHQEKDEILQQGMKMSDYLHTDDTGARHRGKNGVCTHIGNELFAWFESTSSKSRINFLHCLRKGQCHTDYILNEDALAYMREHKLPHKIMKRLTPANQPTTYGTPEVWEALLKALDITRPRHIQIATEGALMGAILSHGWNPECAIMSDDAGQFNVFLHALCWIHAERTLVRLIGFNDGQKEALNNARSQLWDLYQLLKHYKNAPSLLLKEELSERFDAIFTQTTCFATLNHALLRIHQNKQELLLVLDRPDVPLHNNLSEQDVREPVKMRVVKGPTRSDEGRRLRDTFASLKATCRKLGLSFCEYLKDRLSSHPKLPPLSDLMRTKAREERLHNTFENNSIPNRVLTPTMSS